MGKGGGISDTLPISFKLLRTVPWFRSGYCGRLAVGYAVDECTGAGSPAEKERVCSILLLRLAVLPGGQLQHSEAVGPCRRHCLSVFVFVGCYEKFVEHKQHRPSLLRESRKLSAIEIHS